MDALVAKLIETHSGIAYLEGLFGRPGYCIDDPTYVAVLQRYRNTAVSIKAQLSPEQNEEYVMTVLSAI